MSCQISESLQNHAERYVRRQKLHQLRNRRGLTGKLLRSMVNFTGQQGAELPVTEQETRPFLQQLKEWADAGFLISEHELKEKLVNYPSRKSPNGTKPAQIGAFGIPTCGRPQLLNRCLESFIGNFNRHVRSPDILIIDDSRKEADSLRNREILKQQSGRYDGEIYYMNRTQRAALGNAIAQKAGIDRQVTEFALMGHPGCNRSEGGGRNAFLLLTRGTLALQTDDDTICRTGPPPQQEPGLTLTSDSSSDEYWFFESHEDAVGSVEFADEDFLGLHEQLLGKSTVEVILPFIENGETLEMGKLQSSFLRNIREKRARIGITSVGPVGDTCLNTDLYRLFLDGNSLKRLLHPTEEAFLQKLTTRQVIRGVTRTTISDFPRCIGMNFAVDNRTLLPPFMPVQARCDGMFGDLMNICFPALFAASLPRLLEHHPPEPRHRTLEELFELKEQVRVNDFVSLLMYSNSSWPYTTDPAGNLRVLGELFTNLGSYAPDEFEQTLRRIHTTNVSRNIRSAERLLEGAPNRKSYRYRHLREYIERLRRSLEVNDYLMPVDIDQPTSEKKEDFQEILSLFGRMLSAWPDIYESMEEFTREEIEEYLVPVGRLREAGVRKSKYREA